MKKYFIISLILVLFLVSGCSKGSVSVKKEDSDEVKFKQEYESLNGKSNDKDKVYKTIDISANNGIKYVGAKEVIDILSSKSGVIYFGFPECPWCRNAIGVLLSARKQAKLDKIYYYNALKIRDTKHLDDANNVVEDKKGTEEYYKILELLGDKAEVYQGLNDDSIKRLYFPTVVFVKDGKVLSIHSSTVDSQKDPYDSLSKSQKKELKKIYVDGMKEVLSDEKVCDEEGKC